MSGLEHFNNNLESFLKNLLENFPELKDEIENHYDFPLEGTKYIESFYTNCINKGQDISTKNEILFSEGEILLNSVNFNLIWNDEGLDESGKDNIWKNLHTL